MSARENFPNKPLQTVMLIGKLLHSSELICKCSRMEADGIVEGKAVSNCDARCALQHRIAHTSADKSDTGLCRQVDMLNVSLYTETKRAVHVSKQTWCWLCGMELLLWWDVSGQMHLRKGDLCITASDVCVCPRVCVMVSAVGKKEHDSSHRDVSAQLSDVYSIASHAN